MIALAVEYLVKNKRSRLFPKERIDSILTELRKGRFDEARNLCQDTQVFICRVLSPGLEKVKARTEAIETAIAESIERESSVLHTRNGYFSVLATIEPMMGLLGTVLGMIAAFNVIAFQAGLGKPALLAQGVSQALITTAAGLIVAIPAMICFFLFRMDISKKLETAMEIATEAVETIKTVKESGPIEDKPAEEAVPGEPQGETQS